MNLEIAKANFEKANRYWAVASEEYRNLEKVLKLQLEKSKERQEVDRTRRVWEIANEDLMKAQALAPKVEVCECCGRPFDEQSE